MPLKLYKRPSGIWYIRGTFQGVRVDQSARTGTKEIADEQRAALEARISKESIFGREAVIGFAEASIDYMTETGQKRFLAPLITHFKDTPIARIGQADIERAARKLYPNAKPSTRRRQAIVPANAVINHARGRRPKPRPGEEPRPRWLTVEEAERLILNAGRMAPLITFLLSTGVRVGQALKLDWKHVDLENCRAWVPKSKQTPQRWVYFGRRCRAALSSLPGREGPLFLTPKGKPYRVGDGESGGNPVKRGFDKAKAAAGLGGDVTPHTLRHTWASWAYAVEHDPYRIGEYGGWADGQMPRYYVKLCPRGYGAEVKAAGWEMFGLEAAEAAAMEGPDSEGAIAQTQGGNPAIGPDSAGNRPDQEHAGNKPPRNLPSTSQNSPHVPQFHAKTGSSSQ